MWAFKQNIYKTSREEVVTIPLPTLSNPSMCFPGSPSGDILVTGGIIGDTYDITLYYTGMVGTDGASTSVGAHASIGSASATPVCFSQNTGQHAFNLTATVTLTITGTPIILPTSVFYRNGTTFTLFNKYVQVIKHNSTVVTGDRFYGVCAGNDSGPGC